MASPKKTLWVDWDGTAVREAWPRQPKSFEPGFVRFMQKAHQEGVHLYIFSCRLSPIDPFTGDDRDPSHVADEIAYVRDMLDSHGLDFVDVWLRPGKPPGAGIDNNVETFTGSWARTGNRVLARLQSTRARFPALPGSLEETHGAEDSTG